MYNVASLYESGQGVAQNFDTALEWYHRAYDAGLADAAGKIGHLLMFTAQIQSDFAEALRWTRIGAEAGGMVSLYHMGYFHRYGEGVPIDLVEAERWYLLSAEHGYGPAYAELATLYAGINTPAGAFRQNHEEAIIQARAAGATGDRTGQYVLAQLMERGIGMEADPAGAVEWYEKSAAQGWVYANISLYYIYKYGISVTADTQRAQQYAAFVAEAGDSAELYEAAIEAEDRLGEAGLPEKLEWMLLAAERGDADAPRVLGRMYMNGEGTEVDYAESRRWLDRAIALGDGDAMTMLGYQHVMGMGGAVDYATALHLFTQAINSGNPDAVFDIAVTQAQGQGLPQDCNTALRTIDTLMAEGNPEASRARDYLDSNGVCHQ